MGDWLGLSWGLVGFGGFKAITVEFGDLIGFGGFSRLRMVLDLVRGIGWV